MGSPRHGITARWDHRALGLSRAGITIAERTLHPPSRPRLRAFSPRRGRRGRPEGVRQRRDREAFSAAASRSRASLGQEKPTVARSREADRGAVNRRRAGELASPALEREGPPELPGYAAARNAAHLSKRPPFWAAFDYLPAQDYGRFGLHHGACLPNSDRLSVAHDCSPLTPLSG